MSSYSEDAAPGAIALHPPERPPNLFLGTQPLLGFAIVLVLASTLFFFHLGTYGLWEPDEARYAEIGREMLASSNFVVPHLNYVPYIEKPPLLYWLTAFSMKLLGVNELGARLAGACAALLGVLATFLFVLKTLEYRRAILAGSILATSALYAIMAQVLTTDTLLTATMSVAMFTFFLQWREGGHWWLWCFLALGMAVLTKGPIGAVLPLVTAAVFLWWEGEWRGVLDRFHLRGGLLVSTAVVLPWFAAISLRQPDFLSFYLFGEHLRRFFEPRYSHGGTVYFYVPVIAAGFLPWTVMLPLLPWNSLRNPVCRFCLIAAAITFIFFSLANAKLIPYVLPVFPFIAILTAEGLMAIADSTPALFLAAPQTHSYPRPCSQLQVKPRWLAVMMGFLIVTGAVAIAIALNADRFSTPYPAMVHPLLFAAGWMLIGFASLASAAFWFRRVELGLAVLVAGAAATLIVGGYGRLMAESARSYAALARKIERVAPAARLICYPRYIQALPFYCRRRVILVGARTELAYGAEHADDASRFFFMGREELLRLWREPQPTVLVVDRAALKEIQGGLGRYQVIASDSRKLAVTRLGTAPDE